jgi:hypothetical protein
VVKKVKQKYLSYPKAVQPRIGELRALVLKVAEKYDEIDFIGEDLKWGEPSFITKSSGSTFRLDWKSKNPESISLFFYCQTKLISTFKEMYPNDFHFEGNREIRLPLNKKLPIRKLSKCIELAFKYNLIKKQL